MKTHIYALVALSSLLTSSMPAFARHDGDGPQIPRWKNSRSADTENKKDSEENTSKITEAKREPTSKAPSESVEPQKIEQPSVEKKAESESESAPSMRRPFHHAGMHGA